MSLKKDIREDRLKMIKMTRTKEHITKEHIEEGKRLVDNELGFDNKIEEVYPGTKEKLVNYMADIADIKMQAIYELEKIKRYIRGLEELGAIKKGSFNKYLKIVDETVSKTVAKKLDNNEELFSENFKGDIVKINMDLEEEEFKKDIENQIKEFDMPEEVKKAMLEEIMSMKEKYDKEKKLNLRKLKKHKIM